MGKIKDQAMDYFARIPDGHKNAIQRPWNRVVDRCLRPRGREGVERVSCKRTPPGTGDPAEAPLYEENI